MTAEIKVFSVFFETLSVQSDGENMMTIDNLFRMHA